MKTRLKTLGLMMVGASLLVACETKPESAPVQPEAQPAITPEPVEPAAAAKLAPKDDSLNLPPSRQHVRKSNVRLLVPPEKLDVKELKRPTIDRPDPEESETPAN